MRRNLLTLACAAAITTVAVPGHGADPDIGRVPAQDARALLEFLKTW